MLEEIKHILMADVYQHYIERREVHKRLINLLDNEQFEDYVELALGITDAAGNYSAAEHQLGPQILYNNSISSVYNLAQELRSCLSVSRIPRIIYESNLPYLKIGVGSEMAMMLNPNEYWVGNVRTIWTHLLIKHKWNYDIANEELELYREDDLSSEMAYRIWREIYLSMKDNLEILVDLGNEHATNSDEKLKYLWADAIANALYSYEDE
jgi:hypothetical protein